MEPGSGHSGQRQPSVEIRLGISLQEAIQHRIQNKHHLPRRDIAAQYALPHGPVRKGAEIFQGKEANPGHQFLPAGHIPLEQHLEIDLKILRVVVDEGYACQQDLSGHGKKIIPVIARDRGLDIPLHLLGEMVEHMQKQGFLVVEILVERALGYPQLLDDVIEACPLVALRGKLGSRRAHDAVALFRRQIHEGLFWLNKKGIHNMTRRSHYEK